MLLLTYLDTAVCGPCPKRRIAAIILKNAEICLPPGFDPETSVSSQLYSQLKIVHTDIPKFLCSSDNSSRDVVVYVWPSVSCNWLEFSVARQNFSFEHSWCSFTWWKVLRIKQNNCAV